jgi:aldehyde dehydrogenase (NAD+)
MTNLELPKLFQVQQQWRWKAKLSTIEERKKLLRKLKQTVISYEEEIGNALKSDFQKPQTEVLLSEILPVLSEIHTTLKNLHRWSRRRSVGGGPMFWGTKSFVIREARGTVLIISPWNYPFALAMVPLISAIASGNTALLKPSELTPHTSAILEKIISEVFEPRLVAVAQGGVEIATELLTFPFDHIFFTGSTAVGKIVMAAAAKNLSSLTLELGGKSPVIVDATCNIKQAAEKIIWGKLFNSGQTCIAPDYVFVDATIKESFIKELQLALERQQSPSSNNGALIITEKHAHRLRQLTVESMSEGARSLTPTQSLDPRSLSLILLDDPPYTSRVMQEEVFGPILPILTFTALKEPIQFIQGRPKPLALYIFSKDKNAINEILSNTSAGGVCINDTLVQISNHSLPFGGVGESGMGNYHGEAGFRTFTHEKSVLVQGLFGKASRFLYAPYTPGKARVLQRLVHWLTS